MTTQERTDLSAKILQVIRSLQNDTDPWVDFARIGAPLVAAGVQYKKYGFPKLRPFLNEFHDILAFKDECPGDGKPPVCYVQPKTSDKKLSCSECGSQVGSLTVTDFKVEKRPSQKTWLFQSVEKPGLCIKRKPGLYHIGAKRGA